MTRKSKRAVFLDRDGTLNFSPGSHQYITQVEDFHWLPGAIEALAELYSQNWALVVISNQQGVSKGVLSREVLTAIQEKMICDLNEVDVKISGFYYCIHSISDKCKCRKPQPGLIHKAADDVGLDLAKSWMVGDALTDVLAGKAAGCQTILLEADSGVSSLKEATSSIY